MASCSSCGSWIPEGHGNSCSMCYGDIDHGNDGYYRRWAESQYDVRLEQEREQEDKQQSDEAVNATN